MNHIAGDMTQMKIGATWLKHEHEKLGYEHKYRTTAINVMTNTNSWWWLPIHDSGNCSGVTYT